MDGNKDVECFVRLAGGAGASCNFRPSPFIRAEWEFGAAPWLLLRYGDKEGENWSPRFSWAKWKLIIRNFRRIAPLQVTCGVGPVIMMQVENEYGSFGNDKEYLRAIKRPME